MQQVKVGTKFKLKAGKTLPDMRQNIIYEVISVEPDGDDGYVRWKDDVSSNGFALYRFNQTFDIIEEELVKTSNRDSFPELKDGMVVEIRGRDDFPYSKMRIVLGEFLIGRSGKMDNDFEQGIFKGCSATNSSWDIVAVYEQPHSLSFEEEKDNLTLVWKEEILTISPRQQAIKELEETIKKAQQQIEELKAQYD